MKIRWLIQILGQVEDQPDGVRFGQVTDVPDANGALYVANGYAVPVVEEKVERSVKSRVAEERRAASRA